MEDAIIVCATFDDNDPRPSIALSHPMGTNAGSKSDRCYIATCLHFDGKG